MKHLLFFLFLFSLNFAYAQSSEYVMEVEILDFDQLRPRLYKSNDTTYVINFWATWCRPCVEELPHFERLQRYQKTRKVKVLLVSLDFEGQTRKKLIPFINRNKIESEVVHLIDPKMNSWINQVAGNWSGAIPGTLIYNKTDRMFYEGSFSSYNQLFEKVKPFLSVTN